MGDKGQDIKRDSVRDKEQDEKIYSVIENINMAGV